MPPPSSREIVEAFSTKAFAFAQRLVTSMKSFLETHDLMDSVNASNVDPLTFVGMAASFQIREWEHMGILEHMPFHPVLYRNVCENAADLSGSHNIEHIKSMALLLDVHTYYLTNFTRLSEVAASGNHTRSSLWKSGVLTNVNPNQLFLSSTYRKVGASTTPDIYVKKEAKRSNKRDSAERTWSEKEAAEYSGYSRSTLKRMRANGEIPPTLYRQRIEGGKIRYYPESFKAWFEQRQKK